MIKTHYETLGVPRAATEAEIKAAYRKLVLRHHPDRSKDPAATQIFRSISEAYEILADPEIRRRYDFTLDEAKRRAEAAAARATEQKKREAERLEEQMRRPSEAPSRDSPRGRTSVAEPQTSVAANLARLSGLFARQQFAEAERLALEIIRINPREPAPYATLGDIARARGQLDDAARMYSFALQMQPQNEIYLRCYEDILDLTQVNSSNPRRIRIEPAERRVFSILTIVAVTLIAGVYLVWSPERSALIPLTPVSSFTIGVIVMLFLCGVTVGASLSLGNLVDRVSAFSNRRIAPGILLGFLAIVSFPAAIALYCIVGLTQRSFNVTTTRLILSVAGVTLGLGVAALASTSQVSLGQVALWGGNLTYLGALCGWTVADSLKA